MPLAQNQELTPRPGRCLQLNIHEAVQPSFNFNGNVSLSAPKFTTRSEQTAIPMRMLNSIKSYRGDDHDSAYDGSDPSRSSW